MLLDREHKLLNNLNCLTFLICQGKEKHTLMRLLRMRACCFYIVGKDRNEAYMPFFFLDKIFEMKFIC